MAGQLDFLTARVVRVYREAYASHARRLARRYVDKYRVKTTQERGRAGSRRRCGLFKGDYRAVTGVAREHEAALRVGLGFFL